MAATGTHSTGDAAAVASCQSTSRPDTMRAGSIGRCRIRQRRGLCEAISIA